MVSNKVTIVYIMTVCTAINLCRHKTVQGSAASQARIQSSPRFDIQMHIKADLDVWNSTMGMC
jgi:hypothetical protein